MRSHFSLALPLCLSLAACGDKEVDEDDTGGGEELEQGVSGKVTLQDDWCGYPAEVDVYEAKSGESACDWSPEFDYDTGFGDTGLGDAGDWTDNVGAVVATPVVKANGTFSAELDPGSYEARVFEDCYGCVDFSVSEGAVTTVELALRQTIYADAPNIYLYPEVPTGVSVRLAEARHIVLAEPEYPVGGWQALALPDGQLYTAEGPADFLFYELRTPADRLQRDAGWCVEGHLAQASIEAAMVQAGFLHNEIVDFSDFWDAHWPAADWMTVYPQTQRLGALRIQPEPDALLRLWFVVEEGCWPTEAAVLPQVDRVGFHASEWGVVFDRAFPRDWDLVQ